MPSSRRGPWGRARGRRSRAGLCSYRKFQDRCAGTNTTECDFSDLSKYGDHTLRVRAERGAEHSAWVNLSFCPVDDSKSPALRVAVTSSPRLGVVPDAARRPDPLGAHKAGGLVPGT